MYEKHLEGYMMRSIILNFYGQCVYLSDLKFLTREEKIGNRIYICGQLTSNRIRLE